MIICAGEIESFDFASSIGIGLIDPVINLTKIIYEQKPDDLIFVGTAGSYGRYDIFDLVMSSNASQIEHSFLLDSAYSPIDNKLVSHETEPIINSSNYITTDRSIANKFLKQNIDLENMEFYSIMKVAKSFNIKARGLFVVTNYCDENAHKEFLANHDKAKVIIEKKIKEML